MKALASMQTSSFGRSALAATLVFSMVASLAPIRIASAQPAPTTPTSTAAPEDEAL